MTRQANLLWNKSALGRNPGGSPDIVADLTEYLT
jgi:hypothetical protein